jgi:murein DD-endopeptidase MepM/ murein hydrolase activator NlpD
MTFGATPLKALATASAKATASSPEDTAQEKAKLKKACQMFEAQFLKILWKEMRNTVQLTKLNHGGYGEEVFTDLLDQAVSDQSVKNGSMGIADMLERQLSRDGYARPGAKIGEQLSGGSADGSLQIPVDGGVLTSGFGLRQHPITGEDEEHSGIDIAAPQGTPVLAAAAGRVEFAGEQGDYGNLVIITHADGSQTYYGHLAEIAVSEGSLVNSGQKLGTVGSTGTSTGPHLHFETRDASGQAVNPLPKLAGIGFNATT